MSATISHLPGVAGSTGEPPEDSTLESLLPAVPDRITRLIKLYRSLEHQPAEALQGEAVTSVLRALNEGREEDALDLLEIVLEAPGADLDDTSDDDVYATPIPQGAMIWRHSTRPSGSSKPSLAVVGGKEAAVEAPAPGKTLVAARSMPMEMGGDWAVSMGDLEVDGRSRRATLDLGVKGELFLLLRSGALALETAEGGVIAQVACGEDGAQLVRIVYCGGARSDIAPVVLQLEATDEVPLDGIWCLSARRTNDDASRSDRPQETTFSFEHFRPIGVATETAFCNGAAALATGPYYKHKAAVQRGDFARFSLAAEPRSPLQDITLNARDLATRATGMMAVPAAVAGKRGETRPALVEHEGGVEIIIAFDGVTWVAVAPEKAFGPGDDRPPLTLASPEQANGLHQAAFVTPLVSTIDGGFDIMLLCPAYGHNVWMTPGSQSRFLHLTFDDPANIRPLRKPAREDKPASHPARRTAGKG